MQVKETTWRRGETCTSDRLTAHVPVLSMWSEKTLNSWHILNVFEVYVFMASLSYKEKKKPSTICFPRSEVS